MLRQNFNNTWYFSKVQSLLNEMTNDNERTFSEVTLPHDAMILEDRDPNTKNQNNTGYFPGGKYEYSKSFFVPSSYRDKVVSLEFEGVYMNAKVYVNGNYAGKHPYGYTNFYIDIKPYLNFNTENEVQVFVDTSAEPNGRWYTGSGIYRNVKIIVGNPLHIQLDGMKINTIDIEDDQAVIEVNTLIKNENLVTQYGDFLTKIKDKNGDIVTSNSVAFSIFAGDSISIRQRLYIPEPKLWSIDFPNLYHCNGEILVKDELIDEATSQFGIRKIQLDRKSGLRLNGKMINLRGACIHHDNGVLGAATFDKAEQRRIKILKNAGFNAIRSTHNPISKAMLDACDRIGMLVIDEAFEVWNNAKVDYDYALYFHEWWESEIKSMVDKDYNHPSVIIYSIGNEIQEAGTDIGAYWNRKIANKTHSLDDSRFVINSVNGLLTVMDELEEIIKSTNNEQEMMFSDKADINNVMGSLMGMMNQIVAHEKVGQATEATFDGVDIAGYNYMNGRYELDGDLYPNRLIVGSETMPKDIATNWKSVKKHNYLLGDFTWTGWDYIGEAGIGKIDYTSNSNSNMYGSYPWYIAYCGDIDIIGNRRPQSFYREIVWGLRNNPYIAVQKPNYYGKKANTTPWSWSDSISSWSWPGYEVQPIKVEIYSNADEVAVFINNQCLGKKQVGESNNYTAIFDTHFHAGEITAIAYTGGKETGRTTLQSADDNLMLNLDIDCETLQPTAQDLAYIMISITDENGICHPLKDRKVTIDVEGEGVLQGFGSANPTSIENFFDYENTTFEGKALAVIRSKNKEGEIKISVSAEDCAKKTISIPVK